VGGELRPAVEAHPRGQVAVPLADRLRHPQVGLRPERPEAPGEDLLELLLVACRFVVVARGGVAGDELADEGHKLVAAVADAGDDLLLER